MKITSPIFAVFVIARAGNGWAMTTRPGGGFGLPGGKVDAGEEPRDAVIRESQEEGWKVDGVEQTPFHTAIVDGRLCAWYRAERAFRIKEYKEKHRKIKPFALKWQTVLNSGFGNYEACQAYKKGD